MEYSPELCLEFHLFTGYKFDEHEHDSSSSLTLQLANFPGSRPAVTPLRDELLRH